MGEEEARRPWLNALASFLKKVEGELGPLEAVIVYGSAAKGLQGEWSDLDVMLVSDAFKGLTVTERVALLLKHAEPRIEALGYSFDELTRMVEKANPLALNALIEGLPLKSSRRLEELRRAARARYRRRGRVWIPVDGQASVK